MVMLANSAENAFNISMFVILILVCVLILGLIMDVAITIDYDIIYNNKLKWLPTKYGLYFYKISYKDEDIKLYEFNIWSFKRINIEKINKSDDILYMLQDKIKELDSSVSYNEKCTTKFVQI